MSNDLLKVTQLGGRQDSQSGKSDSEPCVSLGTRVLSQGPQCIGPVLRALHLLSAGSEQCYKVDNLTLNETSSGRV